MKKLSIVAALLIAGILALSGCGVSQEDYDAATSKLSAVEAEMSSLLTDLDQVEAEMFSLQADLDQLIVIVDTVRGHIPSDFGPLCAQSSQWHRGELIVWRVRVIDPETGNNLPANPSDLIPVLPDADAIAVMTEGLTVTVHLSDGQSFPMRFGGHGGTDEVKADYFWSTSWAIPEDYPTGVLNDYVTAEWTTEGKSGSSQGFQVPYAFLTILE